MLEQIHNTSITTTDIAKTAATLAAQYDVEVQHKGSACQVSKIPDTNKYRIVLPQLPDSFVDQNVLSQIRFFLDHEVSHILNKSFDEYTNGLSPHEHGVLNALEDTRVDVRMGREYVGAAVNQRTAYRTVLANHLEYNGPVVSLSQQLAIALTHCRVGWVFNDKENMYPGILPEVWPYLCKRSSTLVKLASTAKSCSALVPLARQVAKELADLIESPEQPQENAPNEQSKEDGETPGDQNGQQGNGASGDKEDKEDIQQPEQGNGASGQPNKMTADRDILLSGSMESAQDVTNVSISKAMAKTVIKNSDYVQRLTSPVVDEKAQCIALTLDERQPGWRGLSKGTVRMFRNAVEHAGIQATALRMALQSERKARWQGGKRAGLPDASTIGLLATDSRNTDVMRRLQITAGKNSAVYVLVDGSASMRDRQRATITSNTMTALCGLLDICKVPTKAVVYQNVVPWDSLGTPKLSDVYARLRDLRSNKQSSGISAGCGQWLSYNEHAFDICVSTTIKEWNLPARLAYKELWYSRALAGGGTPTHLGLRMARKDISQRPETRKVILLLTDGSPAWPDQTDNEIDSCRLAGIEVVLLGIDLSFGQWNGRHRDEVIDVPRTGLTRAVMGALVRVVRKGPDQAKNTRRAQGAKRVQEARL
jgi:hypothetical protein